MINVIGLWESEWMEADRTERRLWKQTIQSYSVDEWCMVPPQGGTFTSPVQCADLNMALANHSVGTKVFLIPGDTEPNGVSLASYTHPTDATYIFGNSIESLVGFVGQGDDVVYIPVDVDAHLFASAAVSIVLYDRKAKA